MVSVLRVMEKWELGRTSNRVSDDGQTFVETCGAADARLRTEGYIITMLVVPPCDQLRDVIVISYDITFFVGNGGAAAVWGCAV